MPKKKSKLKSAVKYLQKYMDTYPVQVGYEAYSKETFIDDILYGLGCSLDKKYMFAQGYDLFKKELIKHLTKDK